MIEGQHEAKVGAALEQFARLLAIARHLPAHRRIVVLAVLEHQRQTVVGSRISKIDRFLKLP